MKNFVGKFFPTKLFGRNGNYSVDVVHDFDGANRILVKSESNISSDLRIEQIRNVNQTLSTSTWYTVFERSGVYTVSGVALEFTNKRVRVRLRMDTETIFDIYADELSDILDLDASPLPNFYVTWNEANKAFYFTPNFPIKSNTAIIIDVQATVSGWSQPDYVQGVFQVG